MILLIDNFDSFSYTLADYFLRTGAAIEIVRNDVSLSKLKEGNYSALVISPGPETPEKAGNLLEILAYFHDKVPVLGICLGHQAIGIYFGARLTLAKKPMHGKISSIYKTKYHEILAGIPREFKVTRYHSLELKDLPESLDIILETREGEVMGFVHKYLPVIGLQFHPEAHLTEYGEKLIRNWVNCYAPKKPAGLLY